MTAELSTFSSERRPPADLPAYPHDFIRNRNPLIVKLREYLAVVIERNAVPFELQPRGYGIVTATIATVRCCKARASSSSRSPRRLPSPCAASCPTR